MWYEVGFDFIYLHVDTRLSQHQLLKRLFFPIEWTWHPCQKSTDYKCRGFFPDSQLCSVDLYVYSHASIKLP